MLAPETAARIYAALRARATRLAATDDEADELTQETLLSLLESPPSRSGDDAETLNYAIARMRTIHLREFVGAPRSPSRPPIALR
jgi:DNA-directed RNA polymerase specialized sigma24 family protein